jgi:adenine-specific DNA-methyltransferase
LNYIGSKWSLLPFIQNLLDAKQLNGGVFCDLFSGTTAVGQFAKRLGFQVVSNDWQYYSYVLGKAFLGCNQYPTFEMLLNAYPQISERQVQIQPPLPSFSSDKEYNLRLPLLKVVDWLNSLSGIDTGFVFNNYCYGGTRDSEHSRNYFSDENGRSCDAIRQTLETWKVAGLVNEDEYYLLLAALLDALDSVANTASVYGAFLKHLKTTARKPLKLKTPVIIPGDKPHKVFCSDANQLIQQLDCDVLYLDPPYNRRQYATNYHLLETVALGDNPELKGKTGLRPYEHQRSRYCLKLEVERAFTDLVSHARARHIILSYNDEGFLSPKEIERIFGMRGRVETHRLTYRRFRADKNRDNRNYAPNQNVYEFLFYVRVENEAELAA